MRDGKLGSTSNAEMQRSHKKMADGFGNQPVQIIRASEAYKVEKIDSRSVRKIDRVQSDRYVSMFGLSINSPVGKFTSSPDWM